MMKRANGFPHFELSRHETPGRFEVVLVQTKGCQDYHPNQGFQSPRRGMSVKLTDSTVGGESRHNQ